MKINHLILITAVTLLTACNEETTTETSEEKIKTENSAKNIAEETVVKTDPKVEAIDQLVAELNAKENWDKKKKFELSESTDGGELKFFYIGEYIAMIKEFHYGETGQLRVKYYFNEGQLAYTEEATLTYNAPYYMENEFDPTKIDTLVNESYFDAGSLFKRIENGDHGSAFSEQHKLKEQYRIINRIEELKEHLKE